MDTKFKPSQLRDELAKRFFAKQSNLPSLKPPVPKLRDPIPRMENHTPRRKRII